MSKLAVILRNDTGLDLEFECSHPQSATEGVFPMEMCATFGIFEVPFGPQTLTIRLAPGETSPKPANNDHEDDGA